MSHRHPGIPQRSLEHPADPVASCAASHRAVKRLMARGGSRRCARMATSFQAAVENADQAVCRAGAGGLVADAAGSDVPGSRP